MALDMAQHLLGNCMYLLICFTQLSCGFITIHHFNSLYINGMQHWRIVFFHDQALFFTAVPNCDVPYGLNEII